VSALPPPGSLYAGPTPQRIEIGHYRDSAGNYWLPDPDGAIWPISAADSAALENNLGAGEDARKNRQDILQRVRTKNVVGQPLPAGGPIKLDIRRTLLAIGIALLASMLFTPHKDYWQFLGRTFFVPPLVPVVETDTKSRDCFRIVGWTHDVGLEARRFYQL
jgi:hypothetical protein